jgi:hypothetical protein
MEELMKKTFTVTRIIAVTLVALGICGIQTRAAVKVYADEITSTAAVTAATAAGGSNVAVEQAGSGAGSSSAASNPSVRVDETGVHIGGPNPVDINSPAWLRHNSAGGAHLTEVFAILAPFTMVVAIVGLAGYFAHRRNKMAHETLRAMIDKGLPITPELVAELKSKRSSGTGLSLSRGGRLLPGLILTAVGTALLISGHGDDRRGGLIVLFIGVAFLVVWAVEQKNLNNTQLPK